MFALVVLSSCCPPRTEPFKADNGYDSERSTLERLGLLKTVDLTCAYESGSLTIPTKSFFA